MTARRQQRIHVRTTKAVEFTLAAVRHHTKVTKDRLVGGRSGYGVQIDRVGQARWRAVNAPHPVALVRAGALFVNGKLVE